MPQMFVANITNQIQEFAFRPLELRKTITLKLRAGEQICVTVNNNADLSTPEIDAIISQLGPYGFTDINDDRAKIGAQTPLIYSLGKAIPFAQQDRAIAQRLDAITQVGRKIREDGAIEVDHLIQQRNEEPLPLRKLEMSFVEQPPPKGFPEGYVPLAEGVRVVPDPNRPVHP
jgi:hypothetical protein